MWCMLAVNPYIAFKGNCREAIEFYKSALDAQVLFTQTVGESPMPDMGPANNIMHCTLKVGDSTIMMCDDPKPGGTAAGGTAAGGTAAGGTMAGGFPGFGGGNAGFGGGFPGGADGGFGGFGGGFPGFAGGFGGGGIPGH